MRGKVSAKIKKNYFKTLTSTIAVVWTLGGRTSNFISVLLLVLFYLFYQKGKIVLEGKEKIVGNCLGILLALFQVLGNYDVFTTQSGIKIILLFKYVFSLCGWWMIFYMIIKYLFLLTKEKNLVLHEKANTKGKTNE